MRSVETALLKELDRVLKDALARRALHLYSARSPTTLLLVVACLQLTEETQPDPRRAIAAEALRRAVESDCGLYHLCREWCQLHRAEENRVTVGLREDLLQQLFLRLPADCQLVAQSPPRSARHLKHRCFSASHPVTAGAADLIKPPPC